MKYSMIQAYITFQNYHVAFVDISFSHYQLFDLILAKLSILTWQ
jgi:hypothetical protein